MPRDLFIEALGVPFRLELEQGFDEESSKHLRQIWSTARREPSGDERSYALSIGQLQSPLNSTRPRIAARDLRSLESTLSSRITLDAIEERKHDLVMLHGCAVAKSDGSVYAFVGPSGRGKSTLVRTLARVAQYVTDETVGIDQGGRVYAHPKPLSIIDADATDGLKTQLAADDLGLLDAVRSDLHISRILILDRQAGASGVEIEPISLAGSLELLVPQLSYLPSLPRPLHRIAELYDRVGGFAVLTYSEASDVVATFLSGGLDGPAAPISNLTGQPRTPPRPEWQPTPVAPDTGERARWILSSSVKGCVFWSGIQSSSWTGSDRLCGHSPTHRDHSRTWWRALWLSTESHPTGTLQRMYGIRSPSLLSAESSKT